MHAYAWVSTLCCSCFGSHGRDTSKFAPKLVVGLPRRSPWQGQEQSARGNELWSYDPLSLWDTNMSCKLIHLIADWLFVILSMPPVLCAVFAPVACLVCSAHFAKLAEGAKTMHQHMGICLPQDQDPLCCTVSLGWCFARNSSHSCPIGLPVTVMCRLVLQSSCLKKVLAVHATEGHSLYLCQEPRPGLQTDQ